MTIITEKDIPEYKKFVRYKDGSKLYSMSLSQFEKIAKEAKAVYKVNKMVLVNIEILDKYLELYRLEEN